MKSLTEPSRKRPASTTPQLDMTEPSVFIAEYLRSRGISGVQDSEISRDVKARAEEARERFKRLRSCPPVSTTTPCAGVDDETMTKEQKYNRRLANNRKSAAASRVYAEVLRRETEHALKISADNAKRCEERLEKMEVQLEKERALHAALKERYERMQNRPRDPPSPTSVSEPEGRTIVSPTQTLPPQRLPTLEPAVGSQAMFGLSGNDDINGFFRFSQDNWRGSQDFNTRARALADTPRGSQEQKIRFNADLTKDIDTPRASQEQYVRFSQEGGFSQLVSQEISACLKSNQDSQQAPPSPTVKLSSQEIGQVESVLVANVDDSVQTQDA